MPLKDDIQEAARNEFRGVASLAKTAIESGTYLYPFKGILYFFTHRELWSPLTSRLLQLLTLSAAVVTPMFLFTYVARRDGYPSR